MSTCKPTVLSNEQRVTFEAHVGQYCVKCGTRWMFVSARIVGRSLVNISKLGTAWRSAWNRLSIVSSVSTAVVLSCHWQRCNGHSAIEALIISVK